MTVSASQIFDFLERHETWIIDRHEVASSAFGNLRRSLRQIILKFRDSDDPLALDILDGLRPLLSEWLTVPVPFDHALHDALTELFGQPAAVEARWGSDIRASYEAAFRAANDLISIESPMRERLRAVMDGLRCQRRVFKIYCHRRARPHFESLSPASDDRLDPKQVFLHSLPEYREAEPFDILIKVGPLRARGWGSAPDAIVTAPRFGAITQLVWSGSADDSDFGYDPISPTSESSSLKRSPDVQSAGAGGAILKWTTHVTRFGEDPGAVSGDPADLDTDELRYLQNVSGHREKRAATLVQIDDQNGILYPPFSQVLCFDPDPAVQDPIARRIPGQTLNERMFLIQPNVVDVDIGSVTAQQGSYSQAWKKRLADEFYSNGPELITRLRKAGLNLVHLRSAIEHWCEPPTSVIHAPQQMRHFEILIEVLGLDRPGNIVRGQTSSPWWQRAWVEIRRSRGEAIHSGFLEKDIKDEQLLIILKELLPQIKERAAEKVGFEVAIPPGSDIRGSFRLYPIVAIEHGFRVPETELKIIHEVKATDKWRD